MPKRLTLGPVNSQGDVRLALTEIQQFLNREVLPQLGAEGGEVEEGPPGPKGDTGAKGDRGPPGIATLEDGVIIDGGNF